MRRLASTAEMRVFPPRDQTSTRPRVCFEPPLELCGLKWRHLATGVTSDKGNADKGNGIINTPVLLPAQMAKIRETF